MNLTFSGLTDVDAFYSRFLDIVHDAISQFIPYNSKRSKQHFYPQHIRHHCRLVRSGWRHFHNLGTSRYIHRVKKLRKSLLKFKSTYEAKIADSGNIRKFYAYANDKLKLKTKIGPIKNPDGSLSSDNNQTAELFSQYFHSAIANLQSSSKSFPFLETKTSIVYDYIEFNSSTIFEYLSKLPARCSYSPDGLPYVFLKRAAISLTTPLTYIFNMSLLHSKIPSFWKKATITPIFKKGSKHLCENYRPISLTCSLSKVMERIITDKLRLYFRLNNFYSPYQHGFLNRRSTGTLLVDTFRKFHDVTNKRSYCDCLFIDFRKAFDMVPIHGVIHKLESYGIKGCLLGWLKDFLSNRSQAVKIMDSVSSYRPVVSGVPQGSVLGPFLFLVYINDLPSFLPREVECYLFADDVKILCINNNPPLQSVFNKVLNWSQLWKLPIASNKTALIHLGFKNPYNTLLIDGVPLIPTEEIRDLGIIYSCSLTFDSYIFSICKSASQRSNMILRSFSTSNLDVLSRLYKVYARPLLEYNSFVWSPSSIKLIKHIEDVQRRFTKRACMRKGLNLSYTDRLQKMNLESLEVRRLYSDLLMTYKILHGGVDLDSRQFFTPAPLHTVTRSNHSLKLFHTRTKNKFFSSRVINTWNSLPRQVAEALNSHAFMARLRKVPLSNINYPLRTLH